MRRSGEQDHSPNVETRKTAVRSREDLIPREYQEVREVRKKSHLHHDLIRQPVTGDRDIAGKRGGRLERRLGKTSQTGRGKVTTVSRIGGHAATVSRPPRRLNYIDGQPSGCV